MSAFLPAFLPLAAYIIDRLFGDPERLYETLNHPVMVIGNLATRMEKPGNRFINTNMSFWSGLVCACTVIIIPTSAAWLLKQFLGKFEGVGPIPVHLFIEIALASTLIAHKSLASFVSRVEVALRTEGLEGGQNAVQHLVSRKSAELDESGVCRSAIESLAENFSDAVVAPLFWYVVFGLPGLVAYKAINTLDSMWGYRNDRFEYFGKFAARLDDLANWIPARLSALIVLATAWRFDLIPRVLSDAPKHRSPNAGWPESAFACVMGIRLSGPRVYDEQNYDGPWMGDGRVDLKAGDISDAVRLFDRTGYIVGGALFMIGLVGFVF